MGRRKQFRPWYFRKVSKSKGKPPRCSPKPLFEPLEPRFLLSDVILPGVTLSDYTNQSVDIFPTNVENAIKDGLDQLQSVLNGLFAPGSELGQKLNLAIPGLLDFSDPTHPQAPTLGGLLDQSFADAYQTYLKNPVQANIGTPTTIAALRNFIDGLDLWDHDGDPNTPPVQRTIGNFTLDIYTTGGGLQADTATADPNDYYLWVDVVISLDHNNDATLPVFYFDLGRNADAFGLKTDLNQDGFPDLVDGMKVALDSSITFTHTIGVAFSLYEGHDLDQLGFTSDQGPANTLTADTTPSSGSIDTDFRLQVGTTDYWVSLKSDNQSLDDLKADLAAALSAAGISGVTVGNDAAGKLTLSSSQNLFISETILKVSTADPDVNSFFLDEASTLTARAQAVDPDTYNLGVHDLSFSLRAGFLDLTVVDGTYELDARVDVNFEYQDTPDDGRIYGNELSNPVGTLTEPDTSHASLYAELPVDVKPVDGNPIPGFDETSGEFIIYLATPSPSPPPDFLALNPFDPGFAPDGTNDPRTAPTISLSQAYVDQVLPYNNIDPDQVLGMLTQFATWLESLEASPVLSQIQLPFVDKTLGDILLTQDLGGGKTVNVDVLDFSRMVEVTVLDWVTDVDASGNLVPNFNTVQEFLGKIIASGGTENDWAHIAPVYDPATGEVTFTLTLAYDIPAKADLPMAFNLDLGVLGLENYDETKPVTLTVDPEVGLKFTFGFDLKNLTQIGLSQQLGPLTLLSLVTDTSPIPSNGQLAEDAVFTLNFGGLGTADVVLDKDATDGTDGNPANTSVADLAADLQAAIDAAIDNARLAGRLAADVNVAVAVVNGRLALSTADAPSLTIYDRSPTDTVSQDGFQKLGFADGQKASRIPTPQNGVLSGDAQFTLQVGNTTKTVTVAKSAADSDGDSDRDIDDLVADINAALALAGFDTTTQVQAVRASGTGSAVLLVTPEGSEVPFLQITGTNEVARTELGLYDYQTAGTLAVTGKRELIAQSGAYASDAKGQLLEDVTFTVTCYGAHLPGGEVTYTVTQYAADAMALGFDSSQAAYGQLTAKAPASHYNPSVDVTFLLTIGSGNSAESYLISLSKAALSDNSAYIDLVDDLNEALKHAKRRSDSVEVDLSNMVVASMTDWAKLTLTPQADAPQGATTLLMISSLGSTYNNNSLADLAVDLNRAFAEAVADKAGAPPLSQLLTATAISQAGNQYLLFKGQNSILLDKIDLQGADLADLKMPAGVKTAVGPPSDGQIPSGETAKFTLAFDNGSGIKNYSVTVLAGDLVSELNEALYAATGGLIKAGLSGSAIVLAAPGGGQSLKVVAADANAQKYLGLEAGLTTAAGSNTALFFVQDAELSGDVLVSIAAGDTDPNTAPVIKGRYGFVGLEVGQIKGDLQPSLALDLDEALGSDHLTFTTLFGSLTDPKGLNALTQGLEFDWVGGKDSLTLDQISLPTGTFPDLAAQLASDASIQVEFTDPRVVGNLADLGFTEIPAPGTNLKADVALSYEGPPKPIYVNFLLTKGTTTKLISVKSQNTDIDTLVQDIDKALDDAGFTDVTVGYTPDSEHPTTHFYLTLSHGSDALAAANLMSITMDPAKWGAILEFDDLTFDHIITAVDRLLDVVLKLSSFDFLDESLPILGASVNDLLGYVNKFKQAAAALKDPALAQNPELVIQDVEQLLKEALGLPANSTAVQLSLEKVDQHWNLKLDTSFARSFSGILPLNIDLVGLPGLTPPAGFPANVFQLGGSANLAANFALNLDLDLGVDLETIGGDPKDVDVYVYDSTGVSLTASAKGQNVTFTGSLGPLGIFITGGGAAFDADGDPMTAGDATFTVQLPQDSGDHRYAVGDLTWVIYLAPQLHAGVGAVLPCYFPTASDYIGNLDFVATITTDDATADPFDIKTTAQVNSVPDFASIDFTDFNILDSLPLMIEGFDLILGMLQDALSFDVFGNPSLPLIGHALQDAATFIEDFRNDVVSELKDLVESAPQLAVDLIAQAIYDTLGPGGLNLLVLNSNWDNSDGGLTYHDIQYSASDQEILFNLQLGDSYPVTVPSFDIGLPALGLELQGSPQLNIGWDLLLCFGLSLTEGFFLDTDPLDNFTTAKTGGTLMTPTSVWRPGVELENPLEIGVNLDLGGAAVKGNLLFLSLTGTDQHVGSELTAQFDVGFETGTPERLPFFELVTLADKIDFSYGAAAHLNLGLNLGFNSDLFTYASALPSLVADFKLDWGLGDMIDNSDDGIGDYAPEFPRVFFGHIGLDLGSFFDNVIGPIVEKIQSFTKPIQPLIDIFTTPIPVISDLAGNPITLLDIAEIFGEVDLGMVEDIAAIITMVNSIPTQDVVLYFMGPNEGFTLGGSSNPGLDLRKPDALTAFQQSPLGFFDPAYAEAFQSITGVLDSLGITDMVSGLAGDVLDSLLGSSGANKETASFIDSLTQGDFGGFSFPILTNPATIFGLLLGRPADLVIYDMKPFIFEFEYSQYFPIIGPLGASITGTFGVAIDTAFGFDTYGIQEFIKGDYQYPLDILNGFYIWDYVPLTNVENPEISVFGGISAAAEVNIAVGKAGVGGGLEVTVDFDLNDPNDDGKMRVFELATCLLRGFEQFGPLGPLALFEITTTITAKLFAFIELLFGLWSWEMNIVPPITLLEWTISLEPDPLPAKDLGDGVLRLNIGEFAASRVFGDLSDGSESISVSGSGGNLTVEGFGASDDFSGITRIVAYGGEGDDVIDLSGITDGNILVEIYGGTGNDKIILGAGTRATVYGGVGDDTLIGGDGDDILYGEEGNDLILGKGGTDHLYGGPGNDKISGGAGKDYIFGQEGSDSLYGGAGDDIIRADDNGLRGAGNDVLYGDADLDDNGNLIAATEAGNDVLDGGAGTDEVHGDGGDDTMTGGMGADSLYGDAGNDLIYGDSGFTYDDNGNLVHGSDPVLVSPIFGTAGGDYIEGGADHDRIHAEEGNDTVLGNAGNDTVYGNSGADWIEGNEDHDVLMGQGDNDTIQGNAGNDLVLGDEFIPVDKLNQIPATFDLPALKAILQPGEAGNDVLFGDDGEVQLVGGIATRVHDLIQTINPNTTGQDTILGGAGADLEFGGPDKDTVVGGVGHDILFGDMGKVDYATIGTGNATYAVIDLIQTTHYDDSNIVGDDDYLYGQDGDDTALGGPGDDHIWGDGGTGAADDGTGSDVLIGDGGEVGFTQETIGSSPILKPRIDYIKTLGTTVGSMGNDDVIYGDSLNDVGLGGVGKDTVSGGLADDVLLGDNGLLDFTLANDADKTPILTLIETTDFTPTPVGDQDNVSGNEGMDVALGGVAGDLIYGDDENAAAGVNDLRDILLGDNGRIDLLIDTGKLMVFGGAVDLIQTTDVDNASGGADTISGNAAGDIILGGVAGDVLYGDRAAPTAATIALDGDDVLLGDNGLLDFSYDSDTDLNTLDLVRSTPKANGTVVGGADTISGNRGADLAVGGVAGDLIYGDDAGYTAGAADGRDILLGDNADIFTRTGLPGGSGLSGGELYLLGDPVRTIVTTDTADDTGGADTVSGNAGADFIAGGVWGDTLYGDRAVPTAASTALDGDDLILGDNARFEWASDGDFTKLPTVDFDKLGNTSLKAYKDANTFDTDLSTLDLVTTIDPTVGGRDSIWGDAGKDVAFGGTDSDLIYGDDGNEMGDAANNDLLFGDHGRLYPQHSVLPGFPSRNYFAIDTGDTDGGEGDRMYGEEGDDIILGQQGDDRMWGGSGNDDMLGGHNVVGGVDELSSPAIAATGSDLNDLMDGGPGDDVLAGDNATIWRKADTSSLRFQTLYNDPNRTGDEGVMYKMFPAYAETESVYGDPNVTGVAQNDPRVRTYGWEITILDHDAGIQEDTTPPMVYGRDCLAGNADYDLLFGELGDDIMAGDGSLTEGTAAGDNIKRPITVTDTGGTGQTLYFNVFEAATDGDDYMEGGGGADLMYGGLGQDDMIGGSSDLFGLDTPEKRPDVADEMYGGAATRTAYDYLVPSNDAIYGVRHARDADVIMGDNAVIYRLVNVGTGGATTYKTFNYDWPYDPPGTTFDPIYQGYSKSLRIIPRAVDLLDYDPKEFYRVGDGVNDGIAQGGGEVIHGESGDDIIHGMVGHDIIYAESEDDDVYGEAGSDWITGGTGDDGVLGDDGLIFTSRNSYPDGKGKDIPMDEPLYGIAPPATINELVETPGDIQRSIINVANQLKKTVDITPYEYDTLGTVGWDDIIYGGRGHDTLHGGAGDDGISGAEVLNADVAVLMDNDNDGIMEKVVFTYTNPFSMYHPEVGDFLSFGVYADPTLKKDKRADQFALYDEYDPLRKILLDQNGNLSKDPNTGTEFLLNFDAGTSASPLDDGNDVIFGDLGNDWLVGGTGLDHLYGGLGCDLMNLDDNLETKGPSYTDRKDPNLYSGMNTVPDADPFKGTTLDPTRKPTTVGADLAYGGGGRDVFIDNSGADRMIDWVGEFNSYLTPYAPFGEFSVSRTLMPFVPDYLYRVSASDGADPSRAFDHALDQADPARNGEPFGELALILQKDRLAPYDWRLQTGPPNDPQAGNIPGGKRDVMEAEDFNAGSTTKFAVESGTWTFTKGMYQASPVNGGLALSLFDVDQQLPGYYELLATVNANKDRTGVKSNGYIIFDYYGPTDFKFAGIEVGLDKLQIGEVTASGWNVRAQIPLQLRDNVNYNLLVAVNGTNVTVVVDGKYSLSYTFAPRVVDGLTFGLNTGYVGVASNNSVTRFDNVVAQKLPPTIVFAELEDFADGRADFFAAQAGGWQVSGGRYQSSGDVALSTVNLEVAPASLVQLQATVNAGSFGGLVFDYYGPYDFKFAAILPNTDQVVIGHRTSRGWFYDATVSRTIDAGRDYTLFVSLIGSTVSVSLDGKTVLGHVFNSLVVDGDVGLVSRGGASFDNVLLQGDDPNYQIQGGGELLLAAGQPATYSTETVSEAQVEAMAVAAAEGWRQVLNLDADTLAFLAGVDFEVIDLPGQILGQLQGNTVFIDYNAAGFGWFVDRTPLENSEFSLVSGEWQALAGSPACQAMDLLSAVSHELGHLLGLDHGDAFMAATLEAGERLAPTMVGGLPEGGTPELPAPVNGKEAPAAGLAKATEVLSEKLTLVFDHVKGEFFPRGIHQALARLEANALRFTPPEPSLAGNHDSQGDDWIVQI